MTIQSRRAFIQQRAIDLAKAVHHELSRDPGRDGILACTELKDWAKELCDVVDEVVADERAMMSREASGGSK